MRAMKRKISNRTGSGLLNPREDKVSNILVGLSGKPMRYTERDRLQFQSIQSTCL